MIIKAVKNILMFDFLLMTLVSPIKLTVRMMFLFFKKTFAD